MGSLWGSLSVITKGWNLSLHVMRSVVTLPRLQILDGSWLENSFPHVPIRAWRIPKPTVMWHGFIWAQRQGRILHTAQHSGYEQSISFLLCFLVLPWDNLQFFWGVFWLCRCFSAHEACGDGVIEDWAATRDIVCFLSYTFSSVILNLQHRGGTSALDANSESRPRKSMWTGENISLSTWSIF